MSDPRKPRPSAEPTSPPRLERVTPGGGGAPARPPAPAAPPAPSAGGAAAPLGGHGLAPREVTADAAIAAGLPLEGTLAQASGLRLFGLAAATQASGRLTVGAPERAAWLTFRKGVLQHAAGSRPEDDLGAFLVARGTVTAEQVAGVAEARAAAGGDLLTALVTRGLVNAADVVGHVQEHAAQLVSGALAIEQGGFRWEPGVAPPPGAFPLGQPFAPLCAAVRALDAAAVQRRLAGRDGLGISRTSGRLRLEDLRLTAQEARAAAAFDGRRLSDVARSMASEAAIVLRVALLLAELDLVTFGPARAAATTPPKGVPAQAAPAPRPAAPPPPAPAAPARPPPAAARPAATPPQGSTPAARPAATPSPGSTPAVRPATTPRPASVPAVSAPLTATALEEWLAKHREADHFAVLGVKRDATGAQVKVAYFQLAKLYHPDAVPVSTSQEVRKLAADVFARVSEAWAALGDDAARQTYKEGLETGAGVDVDVMNILQAENVFQAGTLLVKARRYDEAVAKLTEAMALNPDEAEFGMWKTWCEFLLTADKRAAHARCAGAIEAGLKKNPRCVQGYLFLGQMAKIVGEVPLAEKHLKRGLAVVPGHDELTRELKYLRK